MYLCTTHIDDNDVTMAMTTITAEAFVKNVERYLKEALQQGLRIVTSEGKTLHIGQAEALTENGLTPYEEEMLQRSIEAGEEDLRAGHYTSVRTPEELQAFLDAL